jgi:hypothetical protein
MRSSDPVPVEKLLINVVHDLRQPLSTIENSAFLLRLLLTDAAPQVVEQIRVIERQTALAARALTETVAEFRRMAGRIADDDGPPRGGEESGSQAGSRGAADKSLEFTKSQTAAVT